MIFISFDERKINPDLADQIIKFYFQTKNREITIDQFVCSSKNFKADNYVDQARVWMEELGIFDLDRTQAYMVFLPIPEHETRINLPIPLNNDEELFPSQIEYIGNCF